MATSFNTSGSTPNIFNAVTSKIPQATLSTPVANALNKAQSPAPNMSTVNGPKYAPPPVIPPASTPVKKTTVNNVDGSSHITEYHAPASTGAASGSGSATPPQPITGDTTTPSGAIVNATTGMLVSPPPTPSASFPGIVGSLAQTSQQGSPAASQATTGLLNSPSQNAAIGQKASDIASSYGKQIADVNTQAAGLENAYGTTPGMAMPTSQGLAQAAASTAGQITQGLAQGESAALQGTGQQLTAQGQAQSGLGQAGGIATTQQGLIQSGLSSAGGLASPQMQAGMLTNPQNGQPLNPSLVAKAVQDATQLVQNGANVNDPQVQALLNPFGYYGASAFTEAQQALSGGTYNPSSQSAIVQQNLAQGQKYQQQAQDIGTSLQLLGTVAPQLTNFMTQANLNPALAPLVNTQINKIDAQGNPEAYNTMKAVMGETRSFVQSMLQATGGMTPTDAGQIADSYDFSNMTPKGLSDFLDNMQLVGNYRLSEAHSASKSGYGSGSNPAQGPDANTSGTLKTSATGAINKLPPQFKFILGSGSSLLSDVGSAVSGQATNGVAAAVGGATNGIAAAAGVI